MERKRLQGVTYVSTMLEQMAREGEMYGKRWMYPDRSRGNHDSAWSWNTTVDALRVSLGTDREVGAL